MSLRWFFSANKGGRDSGFNDSGIETFKGNFFRYLARELIQNSLDAPHDRNKPVVVKFTLEELPVADLPDSPALKAVMTRCREYWPNDNRAQKFFAAAEQLLAAQTLPCLKIGDFNTTGVCGSDIARDKGWYYLVRCAGASSKGGGEGGSFGIGKNAPFAASDLRTLLYSTKNTDRETAFQGVSNVVTHINPDGSFAQAVGYLGGTDGASARKTADIPERFRRTELGSDIWVLGFHMVKDWQDELVLSVLDNFWPAIHFHRLEVLVGDLKISSENLPALLTAHAGREDFSAHHYYRAFTRHTQHFPRELPTLDHADLYLLAGDIDLPKRVAMVRSSGMVIQTRPFRSPLPFCGVFICGSERGNKILREMEPPRHDEWDPDHPEKGANKKTEAEFVSFIRECVRALTPPDESKALSIPGLGRYLPDDDETPDEEFGGEGGKPYDGKESADRRPKPQKLEGRKIDARRRQLQPDETKPDAGADETDKPGSGTEEAASAGDSRAGTVGDRPDSAANGAQGGPGGTHSKPAIPVFYRTFARNPLAGVYAAVIAPKGKGASRAMLRVNGIGDDGAKIPAALKQARTSDGQELPVSGNAVGPVALPAGASVRLEIVLEAPARISMGVEAHEAD